MAQRVTFRRRNPYNTRSNKIKVVKTPGGILRAQHVKKLASRPKCGDCGIALPGVSTLRPRQYATVSKTQKTVSRVYGGSRCANCVKERIVRAFLIEEQKIVKKVVKEQTAAAQKAEKKGKKN
ncbi:60S ribosomal protein L34 [Maudiozyma exigua]|uniref:60S ribosomal protein L34 n=1 Tax=Maudiozyma exigua TaxID=34358 RepID=A0A9P6VZ60_MAUEX|nr:60S ribosomal protein L34 [Kazachstania exigua]